MGNMGLPMAGNLVKHGFEVKGFDLSEKTLEKASTMVRILVCFLAYYFLAYSDLLFILICYFLLGNLSH